MDNNKLFDYYDNIFSYVKVIMKNVKNENKNMDMFVVKEIFNKIVNDMDSEKIYEMLVVSSLFEKKFNLLNNNLKEKMINDLYSCYIKPMILNYSNNEMEMTKYFFDNLNNKIVDISGFYGIFGEDINIFRENVKKTR